MSYVPTSSGSSRPPKMITSPSESSFVSVALCSESANPLVKRSKSNHNIPQVNPVKKVDLRSSSFHSAAKSNVSPSSKATSNHTSGIGNCVPISKFRTDSVVVDLCDVVHCDASDKVSSPQQNVHNSNKTILPVPIHAKPSGLRMPSPSHRFFDKENVSLPFGFPNSTISSLQRNPLNHYTDAISLSNPIEDYSSAMNRLTPMVNYGPQVIFPLKCSRSDGVNLYLHSIMKSDIDSKRSKNMSKNEPPDSADHSKSNKDVIWGERLKPESSIKMKPISYQDNKLSPKTGIIQEGGHKLKKSDNIILSSGNYFPIEVTMPPDLSVDKSESLMGKKCASNGAVRIRSPSSDFDQAYEISQTTSCSKNENLPNDSNENILKPTTTFSNVTAASSNKSSQVVSREIPCLSEVKEGVLPGETHISLSGWSNIADEIHCKSQNSPPLIKNGSQRLTLNNKLNLVEVDVPLHQQLTAAPFSDEWKLLERIFLLGKQELFSILHLTNQFLRLVHGPQYPWNIFDFRAYIVSPKP